MTDWRWQKINIWTQKKPVEEPLYFDEINEQLASIRGIDDLNKYLYPSEEDLHSPYLLDNIEIACKRIIQAIANNEKICVSYDIDSK